MTNSNWLVTDDGTCQSFGTIETEPPERTYRLYRFLTELEDILDTEPDDAARVQAIIPLVRKLLISSYWLQMEHDSPSEKNRLVSQVSLSGVRIPDYCANGRLGTGQRFHYSQPRYLGHRRANRRTGKKQLLAAGNRRSQNHHPSW